MISLTFILNLAKKTMKYYDLLFYIFVLSFSSIISQTTNIPDIEFEKELISLGVDDVLDGKVLTSTIKNITTLSIPVGSITDLTGIEDFINLTSLDCSANELTSLDVSNNLNLRELYCGGDPELTSLDVSANHKLEKLFCGGPEFKSLDVSANPNLKRILCRNSKLTSLDVSSNTALQYLDVYNNKLTSLDVSANPNLIDLSCSNNQLTSLITNNNDKLKEITCSNNKLTSLDVSTNYVFKTLICYNNQLTSLITDNAHLKEINCSNNQLENLDVSSDPALSDLICSNNQLTSLDVSSNPLLKGLFCDNNQLSNLITVNSLIVLDCDNNQLTSLDVSAISNLQRFYCHDNPTLSSLNIKNGNNYKLSTHYIRVENNPNLYCIEVDDATYSKENWLNKDSHTIYSTNCATASITDNNLLENANIFIRKSKELEISIPVNVSFKIYNLKGQELLNGVLRNTSNLLDFKSFSNGLYIIQLTHKNQQISKKFILN